MQNGWIGLSKESAARKVFGFLSLALLCVACTHQAVRSEQAERRTLCTYEGQYDKVWNALIVAVQARQDVPMTINSKEAGILASAWVNEQATVLYSNDGHSERLPSRYRLNISLRRVPDANLPRGVERVTVTINKELQLLNGDRWKAMPSDHRLEAEILASIDQNLKK